MTVGLTTWDALPRPEGPVLLVLNVEPGDTSSADAALYALAGWAGREALHAVAPVAWAEWLAAQGLAEDRVLVAADDQGRGMELTYFLHTPIALPWVATRRFAAVMGARPHNLYNEEVQGPLERQVCLLLGGGRMLAHTLPLPYVYSFDAAALVHRSGRDARRARYVAEAQAVMSDLHSEWQRAGQPGKDMGPDATTLSSILARHVEAPLLAFDEEAPTPLDSCDSGALSTAVAPWFDDLRAALLSRDERLKELSDAVLEREGRLAALQGEIDRRDKLIMDAVAERNTAVDLRDRIIDLHRRRLGSRLRRLFGRE